MKIYQPAYQSTQTDNTGAVVDSYSFDAWGNRVGDIWNTPDAITHLFDRGYTGHEHLDQFGLINMNGRIYDPKLGRFLSPDPYIQEPENTQSYNRYAYCMNNPFKYTDPSGYLASNSGRVNLIHNIDPASSPPLAIRNVKIWGNFKTYMANYASNEILIDVIECSEGYAILGNTGFFVGKYNGEIITTTDKSSLREMGIWDCYNTKPDPLTGRMDIGDHSNDYPTDDWSFSMSDFYTTIGHINDGVGGLATPCSMGGSIRFFKGGEFSVKVYDSGWRGGSVARIKTTYLPKTAPYLKWGGWAVTTALAINTLQNAYNDDGGSFGDNFRVATVETGSSIAGAYAGAEVGAYVGGVVGAFFGGVGAVPGALIGGFVGGFIGGFVGTEVGRELNKNY